MQEKFHKSKFLPKETLKALMGRRDGPALLRFAICFSCWLLAGAWVVMSWGISWAAIISSHVAFGLFCVSMFAALHESGHGTAFKSKQLNYAAGTIAGMAHIYPYYLFRELHFAHHRYTHIPGKDPEISIGNQPAPSILVNPPLYLAFITGIPFLLLKLTIIFLGVIGTPEIIRKQFTNYIRPKMRPKLVLEGIVFYLIYGTITYLAWYIHPGFWGIFTGQVVGHGFLSMYLVFEHNGLPHEGDILDRTRSIQTNRIVNFLLWNMPYHAEHHAYPAVPFHALPQLHEELKDELKHQGKGLVELHVGAIGNFSKVVRSE